MPTCPSPEAAAQKLQRGQKVRLVSPLLPGKALEGEVEDIRPSVTESSRAPTSSPASKTPTASSGGGSVDAAVVIGVREAAVMVPEQSVVCARPVVSSHAIVDGKAEQRVVQTGGKQASLIEIVTGLKADETVALDGAGFLTNGAPVTVQERGAKPASAATEACGKDRNRQAMTLPELSIRRHVFAWMLSAVLVLFGIISYGRIGMDRYPYIEFPVVSVSTALRGANPDIVDASITNVLEFGELGARHRAHPVDLPPGIR